MNKALKRVVGASALAAAATLAVSTSAFASDTVTQAVTGGTRSASVADLSLAGVATAHSDQVNSGAMTLTADDSTGTGAGWNVTEQASAFVYSGANSGTDIPAADFSITSADAPALTAGQAIDATGTDVAPTGPQLGTLTGVSGTLDAAVKVLSAGVSFGQGTYTQGLNVALTVPADSRVGTYTGTLTTTIASAP